MDKKEIIYLCDRHACSDKYGDMPCTSVECRHTHDIYHAVNFEHVGDINDVPMFIERCENESA